MSLKAYCRRVAQPDDLANRKNAGPAFGGPGFFVCKGAVLLVGRLRSGSTGFRGQIKIGPDAAAAYFNPAEVAECDF